ncbi:rhomboid family intramembrane serine protease [Nocardioides houyundeii]|uniref:rhomboid family intramembrane serine protease n=1 Tax=Nocardioides houyundeii TaxID=2045452 RepID=UPI000C76A573|nr:rhomboid family intramembrane serine protease [Nocardioides houyundeii]
MSDPNGPAAGVPTCYRHPGRETYIKCQRCERPICPDCMRDAAVGFQCPDCVAQGAKTTRSGRAAYGGKRSENPQLTTLVLIGINVAVWLAVTVSGGRESLLAWKLMLSPTGRCLGEDYATYYPGLDSAANCAAIPSATRVPGLADGAWWQAITHGFVHVDIWHIALNAVGLWVLGPAVEAAFGRLRFLAIYLLATLAAGATIFLLADPTGRTLGASGGVFGLMGALIVVSLKVHGDIRSVMTLLAVNLAFTFAFPGISWQGHLGGLLGGAAAAAILILAPRGDRRGLWQWSGLAVLTVALVAVLVLRAGALS